MHLFSASRWLLVLPATLLCACGSGSKSVVTTNKTYHLSGKVVTETNVPIVGAEVTLANFASKVVTDGNGTYDVVATNAKAGDSVAVLVTHPDYSRLASTLNLTAELTQKDYSLRKHDVDVAVTLPASATDAPATVATTREDGGTQLSIGFGALVLPNGTAATGQAQVKLTYWHPSQSFETAPAPLVGALAGNPNALGLFSYGMASIEISQGNDVLKVADGKTLDLTFTQPEALKAELFAYDPAGSDAPMLWYADETTGIWSSLGSIASGALAVDANTKTISAKLPHLSGFNIDGIWTVNQCVTGKVVDSCGKPQANTKLTLWLTGGGQVLKYDVDTGADGSFCSNLIGSSTAKATDNTVDFYAWVSARDLPAQTTCSPVGKKSVAELCNKGPSPLCTGNDEYAGRDSRNTSPVSFMAEAAACNIPLTKVPLCGYCSGTGSTASLSQCKASSATATVLKGSPAGAMHEGACGSFAQTLVVPWCGTPPTSNEDCTAAGARGLGEACDESRGIYCCPRDKYACSDYVCVPLKD